MDHKPDLSSKCSSLLASEVTAEVKSALNTKGEGWMGGGKEEMERCFYLADFMLHKQEPHELRKPWGVIYYLSQEPKGNDNVWHPFWKLHSVCGQAGLHD